MTTERERAKAQRRQELLKQAAAIMAEKGFHQTRLADVGAAVGISGPALYRHFANKEDLLGAILIEISIRLVDGARAAFARHTDDVADNPGAVLEELLAMHVGVAVDEADLVRVQGREIDNLEEGVRAKVRSLQRAYLGQWTDALLRARPDLDRPTARVRVQAAATLLNAARYVLHWADRDWLKEELTKMARAAMLVE